MKEVAILLSIQFLLIFRSGLEFTRDMHVVANEMPVTESFIQETLRLVQQSLTLRKVMNEVDLVTEIGILHIPAGVTIATLLSITNVDQSILPSSPDVHTFCSDRYKVSCIHRFPLHK